MKLNIGWCDVCANPAAKCFCEKLCPYGCGKLIIECWDTCEKAKDHSDQLTSTVQNEN
jgi:hypothetical protein